MINRFVQFTLSISLINRYIQKIEKNAMAKYGLKGSHAECIIALSTHPEGIISASLGDFCDKDKAAISRTVSELEGSGYVKRVGVGSNLYRARIVLTDKGEKLAAELSELAHLAVVKADEGISEADRAKFYEMLNRFASNLEKISIEGLEK